MTRRCCRLRGKSKTRPSGWSTRPARQAPPAYDRLPLLLHHNHAPLGVDRHAIAIAIRARGKVVVLALLLGTQDLAAGQALQGDDRGHLPCCRLVSALVRCQPWTGTT